MQQLELVSLLEKRKLIRNTAIRYVGKYIGDLSPIESRYLVQVPRK